LSIGKCSHIVILRICTITWKMASFR